ncbi:PA1571 family protein [Pseudomonas sp. SCB32]|uniref:PA1571 family protein n=1 Tax=Pseudomonas sp. SCB32 TaxID=2653853 RepID=UPI0015B6FC58|nr:PA1571 family protein [Pseudomonas sp. SCB32]
MSLQHQQNPAPRPAPRDPQQPVGGSIIDAQGREIPITEDMIQRACRELEKSVESPRR